MARFEIDASGPKDGRQDLVNAVIETPAGSRNKFTYVEELGLFRLHKILPMGSAFPFDFGFIPGTLAEDGDPLDLLVLGEEATFTGCAVTVRLLGVIEALQTEDRKTIRNDRLIGTPEGEKIKPAARSIDETARARGGAQAPRTGSPEIHAISDEEPGMKKAWLHGRGASILHGIALEGFNPTPGVSQTSCPPIASKENPP